MDGSASGSSSTGQLSVEFRVENERYPFVDASALESCVFELEEMVPRGDGVYSEFFRIVGADTDRILDVAAETPQVTPTLLEEAGDESLFEFEVEGGCIAVSLAEAGAYPRVVRADDGEGTVVADFPTGEARPLVRKVLASHEGVSVVTQSGADEIVPAFTETEVIEVAHDVLTRQQRSVLVTALADGFYAWPQETTLDDLAHSLDLEEPILDTRLHNAEQEILAALFEEGTLGDVDGPIHPFVDTQASEGDAA